ncbi:MAG: PmoA family protein [Bryobacteraceae bacterium]|nr:PmoA family protein [Bryobacteraceae bacterium]
MKLIAALPFVCVLSAWGQVTVKQDGGVVSVQIDGKPFTSFYVGEETAKPYLHPLRTATGKIVTRRYPMEAAAGEKHDHPHHQGLWFAHGDVNGIDFWSALPSRTGEKYGRVALKAVSDLVSGKKGSITGAFEWQDANGKPLLREDRTMTFHRHPELRIIDFDIRLTGIAKAHFGDTKEGTFAIRMADSMKEENGGKLVNAEGASGEKATWGKRSNWMDYSGEVEGERAGVAIFDHPGNPKHPTYWHVRGYGLFATNIFGEHDFYNDKARDGGMTLEPGQTWRFRYRVVIHPGDAVSAGVARLYEEYAKER